MTKKPLLPPSLVLQNSLFNEVAPELLFTRNDSQDPRLGEFVKRVRPQEIGSSNSTIFIWGYPDDEGIQLNGGRPGAALAPDRIRKYLYKMTPHLFSSKSICVGDLGNVEIQNFPLADRHRTGKELTKQIMKTQIPWISLGGGHDYGYSDTAGFVEYWLSQNIRPLVINFDAHLDVRSSEKGFHSGTPFYRTLTEYPQKFDFLEVGIQPQCNSKHHLQWCEEQGGKIISIDQINKNNLLAELKKHLLALTTQRPCFLSLDMDVFSSDCAPGCSQSWATGLSLQEFLPTFQWLRQNLQVSGLGIYECSPPLDQDDRTSKLAALLAHQFIF